MSKNILVISTSPRKDGNSETLANEFIRGAKEAGNNVEKICLYNKNIGFCKGCLTCQKTSQCIIHDDANSIIQKMVNADTIVFSTPIYFYEMCGQMKTMLDRTNPLFPIQYAFRDIYLLAAAAEKDESAMDGTVNGLQGWLNCFDKTQLSGTVFAGGVVGMGAMNGHPALEKSYEMGKLA